MNGRTFSEAKRELAKAEQEILAEVADFLAPYDFGVLQGAFNEDVLASGGIHLVLLPGCRGIVNPLKLKGFKFSLGEPGNAE
jgi:hypothetical protein